MFRRLFAWGSVVAVIATFLSINATSATATQPDPHKVTICHRTNAPSNPYVRITVDVASVDGDTGNDNGKGDHNAEHNGPVFDITGNTVYTNPRNGDDWGDIIPPFWADGSSDGVYWPSKNWPSGEDIFNAGCKIPNEPEETFLTVTKDMPDVFNDSESVTIEFTLYFVENGQPDGVVDTCQLTFDASTLLEQQCDFEHLTPGVNYLLDETDTGGFTKDPKLPYSFIGGDTDGLNVKVANTFSDANAEACKVTDVGSSGYDPSLDLFSFDLVMVADPSGRYDGAKDVNGDDLVPGGVIETVQALGGGTAADPNCSTFSSALKDNVTYDIVEETAPSGWTTTGGIADFTPQFPADAGTVYKATFTNSISAAHAKACKVTSTDNTGYDPSNEDFTFDLLDTSTTPPTLVKTVTVKGGGTAEYPNCATFDVNLQAGSYRIAEETPATGWATIGAPLNFTVTYPADSGKTFKYTATNSITPASARACKITPVVNGYGFQANTRYFHFTLKENGTAVSDVWLQGGGTTTSPVCATFKDGTHNFFLQHNKTYTVMEDAKVYDSSHTQVVEPGWTFGAIACRIGTGTTNVTSYTPVYPGASGVAFTCTGTNTRTFAAPLTPGYWKNHLAKSGTTGSYTDPTNCSKVPSGTSCSSSGPFAKQYLPQTLGSYSVGDIVTAAKIFVGMNCSSTKDQDAVGCLAGHLLATKLNLANGADGTCVSTYVGQADAFLTAIGYTPTGKYALSGTQRNAVIALKSALDKFNNGLGCS
ncbi:MAG: hypothetical protein ACJ76A_05715 [Actinomycetota bacterium]